MNLDEENGVHCYAIYGEFDGVNFPALRQYILDSVDILSFWNHLPGLFLIKTKIELNTFTYKIAPFFGGKFFIVMQVNPSNVNGVLPLPAWEWFRTPAPPGKVSGHLYPLPQLLS
ncbi:hypothetical protein AGR1A_Lc80297 [Agrobacterium fabacearum CFBP 5771]|uniref:hypothetical protein n=1 Tax=Agrobacterium tumefaciens TaxID=358 RepID=UPI0009D2E90E|nr:hypothetical protein [Agrobacterium tumefaciens]CVI22773.1 hypothetical protein AGR1A_Lc80297 [Agrobacterium fabacearum CFBP 5771]